MTEKGVRRERNRNIIERGNEIENTTGWGFDGMEQAEKQKEKMTW